MNLRCALSVLAVAALSIQSQSFAQNNFNNLGNINGANSIDNSSRSTGNSANNVLDSDELNSMNNAGGMNGTAGNSADSGNSPADADAGLSGDLNSNLNSGLNNGNSGLNNSNTPGNPANSTSENSGKDNLGSLNTGVNNKNLNPTQNPTAEPPPPPMNPSTTNVPPTPPTNVSPGPGAGDAPPPPQVGVDPNAPAAAEPPAAPVPPRKPTRAELRQARLELIKKMAESIPALRPGEAPLEYVVQPGDTLWDISDQLLDDALWWPKLWVLNPEVADPDRIEPGIRLVFYPSTAAQAPELAVQDAVDPFGPPKVELATLQTFSMEIKRWEGPNGEIVDASRLPGDQNLLSVGDPMYNASFVYRLPGFFSSSSVDSVGEILSNANSPLVAGQGQNLIARFDTSPRPGERYLVLRETPILSNLEAVRPDGNLFSYVGTVGVVRVTSDGHATLVAEDSGSYISPSDVLIPANKNIFVPVDPLAAGRPNKAPAYVVGTESGVYHSAGPGIAVYLQGTNGANPFAVGDDVELFMPQGSSYGFGDQLTPRERVAVARIVDATPETAVGLILNASREVTTGASTMDSVDEY